MAVRAVNPEIDLDLTKIVLDVVNKKIKGLDTRIEGSIVAGDLERTIDGASTLNLTVHDPKRALLQSGMFSYAIQVSLDRFLFKLVKVGKSGDDLVLTFEDRAVAALRQHSKTRHAKRSAHMTRAMFALSLVREVKPRITFVCPELHATQPIVGAGDKRKGRKALPYQFRRGEIGGTVEDSWTCLQRLAQEVNWRCFSSEGAVWFISDAQLLKAKPKLSLTEQTLGVDGIDFDIDNGKVRSEVTLTCRASRWLAGPGAVVELAGVGPANGLWLCSDLRRGLFDTQATITLKRATKKLAEPAPETAAIPSPSSPLSKKSPKALKDAPLAVQRAYAAAESISAKQLPYVWGGGHPTAGRMGGSPPGYDCSGAVSAVLAAGGLGMRPGGPSMTSGPMEGWGRPGRGQWITVYCSSVHAFMVFTIKGVDHHFGTGRWGKSWGGAGFNPELHPTGGFTVRHWPGT